MKKVIINYEVNMADVNKSISKLESRIENINTLLDQLEERTGKDFKMIIYSGKHKPGSFMHRFNYLYSNVYYAINDFKLGIKVTT